MKYVFIEKHQAEFSIKAMCRVLGVARSGWYAWCQRRVGLNSRQQFRQRCDSAVHEAFHRAKQRYGAPRLTDELHAQGSSCRLFIHQPISIKGAVIGKSTS